MALFPTTLVVLALCLVIISLVAATSPDKDGYEVTQIHIAQGKLPNEMSVAWVTAKSAASQCAYGVSESSLDQSVSGEAITYSYTYAGSTYNSGFLHSAVLTGLKPRTRYFYRCGDFSTNSLSGIISFETLPAKGDLTVPLTFGLVGDLGMTDDSKKTLAHMTLNPNIDMILHVGDLSYANCDHNQWDQYGVMVESLASQTPWMAGAGNHEIEMAVKDGAQVFTAFEKRFRMPAVKPAEFGPITYYSYYTVSCCPSEFQSEYNWGNSFFSFDSGMVHVVNLNPYSTTNTTSAQYNWLIEDLKSVDREVTPWVVVMMHCPWYNSNKAHHNEWQAVEMRKYMESIFYEYKVNVAFAGHVHAYERSYPIFNNDTKSDGVVYIDIGDGGNAEGHANTYYELPTWTAYRNGTQYGHGELVFYNKTHMSWTWNRNADGIKIAMDNTVICNTAYGPADCSSPTF